MEYIYTIILGLVQGITEFAPVSSSGHLVLLHELLPLNLSSELAFDVALHAGTLVAIVIFFAKDIIHYVTKSQKVLWFLIISSIPAGIIGLLFESLIDDYLRSTWVVVVMLIIVGLWFFWVEKVAKPRLKVEDVSLNIALGIGFAQIAALIPGTSRSGITISVGMMLGLKRDEAARFSFLMVVPVLAGATLKKVYDLYSIGINASEIELLAIGFFVSCMAGIMVIRYLLQFLKKYSLRPFAWYRLALALVVILAVLL